MQDRQQDATSRDLDARDEGLSSRDVQSPSGASQKRARQLDELRALIARAERRTVAAPVRVGEDVLAHSPSSSRRPSSACSTTDAPVVEPEADSAHWCLGIPEIDAALPLRSTEIVPGGGEISQASRPHTKPPGEVRALDPTGLHEICGASYRDRPAAVGFACALLARLMLSQQPHASSTSSLLQTPLLMAQTSRARHEFGRLYGPGLMPFGVSREELTERLICVEAPAGRDVLWTLEEAARTPGLLAALGEVDRVGFTESRRLSLAAAAGGTPVLLMRSHDDRTTGASETRWRIAA
ncbi:MAG: hypothetical protein AAFQ35_05185, partial [Pseudomonadota bacterium]